MIYIFNILLFFDGWVGDFWGENFAIPQKIPNFAAAKVRKISQITKY